LNILINKVMREGDKIRTKQGKHLIAKQSDDSCQGCYFYINGSCRGDGKEIDCCEVDGTPLIFVSEQP